MKLHSGGLGFHMRLSCLGLLMVGFLAGPAIAEQSPNEENPSAAAPRLREPVPSEPKVIPSQWEQFKDRFGLIGYLDANLSYSRQTDQDSESLGGGGVSAVISPVYRANDHTALILTYDGSYRRELDFNYGTDGPRKTTEYMRHTVTPMVQFDFGENSRYIIVPSFFYTRTYNNDADGGGFDDGLYNYRDIGGGVDFRMKGLDFWQARGTGKVGFQYYDRNYLNFKSLLNVATGNGIEEDEHDYQGMLGRIGYTWSKALGFSWRTEYYILYKDYDDGKVVESNGVLSSKERADYLHNLNVLLWFIPYSLPGLRLEIDLNGSLYDSNQNFYDNMGNDDFDDDVFINDYYNYYAFRVGPNVSYTFKTFPLTATLTYSYGRLQYTDRPAQDESGAYKSHDQWETEQIVGALLSYALNRHLNVYAQYRYLTADSNNSDTSTFQYEHTVHYFYGGMALRF